MLAKIAQQGPTGPPLHHRRIPRLPLHPLQAVWSLERCSTPGGLTLKLTCHSYTLPSLPASTRMVNLAALAPGGRGSSGGNPRATPRLWAATDGGRLLRLRSSGPPVDRAVDVEVCCMLGGWVEPSGRVF